MRRTVVMLAVALVTVAGLAAPAWAETDSVSGTLTHQGGGHWTNYTFERTGTSLDRVTFAPSNLIDQTSVYSTLSIRMLFLDGTVWPGSAKSWVNSKTRKTLATGTWAWVFRLSACCYSGGDDHWAGSLTY
jgi:hypothetical protein